MKLKIYTLSTIIIFTCILNANEICNTKINEIESKITKAREIGNKSEVNGLEKSLNKLKNKCNDKTILNDLQAKVKKYEDKLEKTQQDIQKAKQKGKNAKVKAEELKAKTISEQLESAKKALEKYLNS